MLMRINLITIRLISELQQIKRIKGIEERIEIIQLDSKVYAMRKIDVNGKPI